MSDEENRYTVRLLIIERAYNVVGLLIKGTVYCIIAYYLYCSVEALAGSETGVSIALGDTDYGIPWVLAFFAGIWALGEHELRLRKVSSMQEHIKKLESRLDPNRTSSNLLPDGQTNPEDKL